MRYIVEYKQITLPLLLPCYIYAAYKQAAGGCQRPYFCFNPFFGERVAFHRFFCKRQDISCIHKSCKRRCSLQTCNTEHAGSRVIIFNHAHALVKYHQSFRYTAEHRFKFIALFGDICNVFLQFLCHTVHCISEFLQFARRAYRRFIIKNAVPVFAGSFLQFANFADYMGRHKERYKQYHNKHHTSRQFHRTAYISRKIDACFHRHGEPQSIVFAVYCNRHCVIHDVVL